MNNMLGPRDLSLQKTHRQTYGHTIHAFWSLYLVTWSLSFPCTCPHYWQVISKKEYSPKQGLVQDLTKIMCQFLPHSTRSPQRQEQSIFTFYGNYHELESRHNSNICIIYLPQFSSFAGYSNYQALKSLQYFRGKSSSVSFSITHL